MPPKAPSQKAIKSFFKLVSLDLAVKVKAELDAGMPVDVAFDEGYGSQPALAYAIERNKDGCIRVLLEAGADVNATGSRGDTALHEATTVAHATGLLDRGADVNVKNAKGWTPLHAACAAKRRELVELYLARGAAADPVDAEGRTPYAVAGDPSTRIVLAKHGAKGLAAGGGTQLSPKAKPVTWKDVMADRGAIGIDRAGILWMGGYSGLYRFDGTAIVRYQFTESMAYTSIEPGPDGVVYIATNWGLIEVKDEVFTLYTSENSELFDNHLVYMRTDPSGKPHMVSYEDEAKEKHISVFDGESFSVLVPGKDFPAGLELECLEWDAAGQLVIGADNSFAIQRAGDWKVIDQFGSDDSFEPNVYALARDGDALWIGASKGVFEYRGGKFKKTKTDNLAKHVCVDGGVVWVGMSYGGVGRIEAGKLTVQTQKNSALPTDDIERIVRGPDGTVWVHAGSDVLRIDNGVLVRMSGKAAAPPPPKPTLLAFPKKAIVPKAKLPKSVVDAIEEAKLASVTAAQLLAVVRPAIAFDCVKYKTVPVGASKFGGQPDLPKKLAWPSFSDDDDAMLPFVMQIELAALHAFDKEGLLPATGMLYFFSDTAPDDLRDARVLYADAKVERRAFPEDLVDRVKQRDFIAQVPEYKIELAPVHTLPSRSWFAARADLTDDDAEKLDELRTALIKLGNKKLPQQCSRLLGWPDSVQDEVVDDTARIALLQLNGYELSPKGIEKVFEHWCGDGLIHVVIPAAALAKKQFAKAEGTMAYT